ncbi:MAG: flagellin [Planctomycetaceae bacterium]|nr:flagellin [Planctomycetales bacterium]MCB9921238.1 flagellin [Planctomycetaceae bacterium]
MLSIGAGIVGGQTQQVQRTFDRLADTSVKLATLKRINRGSDDPAGLIAATELNRELTALEEASAATERTRAVVHLADRGLGQASDLLNQIEGNLVASASGATSTDERAAHQIEIDAAVDALDRIGLSTTFAGRQVFTGEEISVLTGPNPTDSAQLEIPSLSSSALGGASGRLADVRSGGLASDNPQTGDAIVKEAREQILSARAELAAFERYSIDSAQRLFDDTAVNLSASLSRIADADVAMESANLVKAMTLADTSLAAARLTLATQRAGARLLSELFDAVS